MQVGEIRALSRHIKEVMDKGAEALKALERSLRTEHEGHFQTSFVNPYRLEASYYARLRRAGA